MGALTDQLTAVYTAQQVCQAARITYRQLDYAVVQGHVLCVKDRARPGKGYDREFRPVDVHVAAVMGRLSELGAGHKVRRNVAVLLYATPRPWDHSWIVVTPNGYAQVYDGAPALCERQWVLRLPPTLDPLP